MVTPPMFSIRCGGPGLHNGLHVHSAIDVEHVSGDVAGFLARKKTHRRRYILHRAETPQRDMRQQSILHLVGEPSRHVRFDEPRSHGIDGYIPAGDLLCQRLGQPDQSGL